MFQSGLLAIGHGLEIGGVTFDPLLPRAEHVVHGAAVAAGFELGLEVGIRGNEAGVAHGGVGFKIQVLEGLA